MKPPELTPQEEKVYRCIYDAIERDRYVPSRREIAELAGIPSLGKITELLRSLEAKGLIRVTWEAFRAISLAKPEIESLRDRVQQLEERVKELEGANGVQE